VLRILLLAGPDAPGAGALLARARAETEAGRPLEILLVGGGLSWRDTEALAGLAALPGVGVGLCSRSARDGGVLPDALPAWLRWTSLVAFLTQLEADAALWGLLP
jgi:hypothetical protein